MSVEDALRRGIDRIQELEAINDEMVELLRWYAYPGPASDRPSDFDLQMQARELIAKAKGD